MDSDGTLKQVWYLRQLDLFRSLTDAQIDEITGLVDDHYIPAGAELLHDRQRERLYLVKTGAVGVYTDEPHRVLLALLGPGCLFGLSSTFGDTSPMIGATTLEPSYICFTTWSKLQHVLVQWPDVMLRMAQALIELGFAAETGVPGGRGASSRQRLAKLLVEFCRDFADADERGHRVRFRLTHADLAGMINVTRETVSRLLTEFSQAGLVARDQGRLLIRDCERLELLAHSQATDGHRRYALCSYPRDEQPAGRFPPRA